MRRLLERIRRKVYDKYETETSRPESVFEVFVEGILRKRWSEYGPYHRIKRSAPRKARNSTGDRSSGD